MERSDMTERAKSWRAAPERGAIPKRKAPACAGALRHFFFNFSARAGSGVM